MHGLVRGRSFEHCQICIVLLSYWVRVIYCIILSVEYTVIFLFIMAQLLRNRKDVEQELIVECELDEAVSPYSESEFDRHY
jgi:hypothetical protein